MTDRKSIWLPLLGHLTTIGIVHDHAGDLAAGRQLRSSTRAAVLADRAASVVH